MCSPKNRDYSIVREGLIDLQSGTASILQVYDGQHFETASICELIADEAQLPFLVGPVRTGETVRSLLSFFFFFLPLIPFAFSP